MNWLTKIKTFGDKIKKNLQKKFPTKEEIDFLVIPKPITQFLLLFIFLILL